MTDLAVPTGDHRHVPGPPADFVADRRGVDALTSDGRVVRIRPPAPTDAPALRALYEGSGDTSLYQRFFAINRAQVEAEVARLTRPTGADYAALVACDGDVIVGVASYEPLGFGAGSVHAGGTAVEFAVFVADQHQGRGIGTLLLEHLRQRARRRGVTEMVGQVLPGNAAMLQVAQGLGTASLARDPDGVVEVRLSTAPDETALSALDARDRAAARRSLSPLFAPRTVAVVGAGRRPGGIGHEVLRHLVADGVAGRFTGTVFPVNPHASHVAGMPAYPDLASVPEPVDLAVVAVPAAAVPATIDDAAAAGVGAVVVLSAGFRETDAAGAARQREVVRRCRAAGIRLVGPNCLGVLNTDPAVRLAATFAVGDPPPGRLAVASQSGAVGIAVLDHARRTGTGVSSFVSLGNKADVSGNDLLSYWYDDPATSAVALYLESFGNPRRFARIARTLSRRKPLLVVKSGRSTGGRRAGQSHTAATATPDVAVDSLFAQAGVIRTDTLGELLDTARILTDQPLPAGSRLAVIGNAGGVGVLAADAAEAAGLVLPELSPALREKLADGAVGVANPVDLGAAATPSGLAAAVDAIASSGEVDAVVAVFAATRANDVPGSLAALATAADRARHLPFATVLMGVDPAPHTLGERKAPVYALPEQAVRALAHATSYATWRRTPLGHRPELSDVDIARARAIILDALTAGRDWLDVARANELLRCYGIPVVTSVVVHSEAEAAVAASRVGYPVALKSADPSLVHKTDSGAVRLDVADAAAARAAYRTISHVAGPSVLVQPMVPRGVELVAGVVHDPLFGSLVMVGLGGVHTDLLGDRSYRLLPVTDLDAARMWRNLRGAPLLTGYRGAPPVATAAVEDLLVRVGRLAEDFPEVAELDLNPVIASADGVAAVDVKLRLAAVGDEPDPALRALREPT